MQGISHSCFPLQQSSEPFLQRLVFISFLMIVLISSSDREKVDFIAKWLAGNIWGTDWPFIWALLPWLIVLVPLALYRANKLNILQLNESTAIGLGLPLERERVMMLIIAV